MNKKILTLLAVLMLSLVPMTALAYDQAAPYSVSVNYVTASNTGFSVNSVSQTMEFNGPRDTYNIPAAGTNNGANPWGNITNDGNVRQSFRVKLTQANPTGISLRISNSVNMNDASSVSTTLKTVIGWNDVASTVQVFIHPRANFTATVADGTVSRTLNIESGAPVVAPTPEPPEPE